MSESHLKNIIRSRKLRSTPNRITILRLLMQTKTPLSAEEVQKRIKGDLVTVYRNLHTFVSVGFVRELRFQDAVARYEYVHGSHHHHAVCTGCGVVSELDTCDTSHLDTHALRHAKNFVSITNHSLEFFGTCTQCARA